MLKIFFQRINLIKQEFSVVINNFISISILKGVEYLIPLIIIPYYFRIAGDDYFGLVMFVHFVIQFFIIVIDYGFDYTATRDISVFSKDKEKINEIFSSVIIIKSILSFLGFIVLIILISLFSRFRQDASLYIIYYLTVIGKVLFPLWFFQGIAKMKFITLINIIGMSAFILLVFLFLKNKQQYLLYPIFYAITQIFIGLMGFIVAIYKFKVKLYIPKRNVLLYKFKKSTSIFISNFASSIYMTAPPFLLGVVTGQNSYVGYYTVAEKAVRGIRYLIQPLTQALYPHFSTEFSKIDPKIAKKQLAKLLKVLTPILLIMVLSVIYFAEQITVFLTGEALDNVILNMRILSVIIVVGTFNSVLGVLGLINMKKEKQFRNFMLITGVVSLISCTIFSYYYFDLGAIISVILAELVLLILISKYLIYNVK